MKFTVMFKDPDGVWEALADAAKHSIESVDGLSNRERENLAESRKEQLGEFASRWIEYGEYLEVEFDTESNTARIVEKGR
jgi:hypothetical protein